MMIVVGGFSGLRWVGVGWCNVSMRVGGVDKGKGNWVGWYGWCGGW